MVIHHPNRHEGAHTAAIAVTTCRRSLHRSWRCGAGRSSSVRARSEPGSESSTGRITKSGASRSSATPSRISPAQSGCKAGHGRLECVKFDRRSRLHRAVLSGQEPPRGPRRTSSTAVDTAPLLSNGGATLRNHARLSDSRIQATRGQVPPDPRPDQRPASRVLQALPGATADMERGSAGSGRVTGRGLGGPAVGRPRRSRRRPRPTARPATRTGIGHAPARRPVRNSGTGWRSAGTRPVTRRSPRS